MRDTLIIGGGPAGLTAALYAARAGRDVLLLEKSMAGGQMSMTSRIENYPGFADGVDGAELCMAMEAQATRAGAEIRYESALQIDCAGKRVQTPSGWIAGKSLILALGAKPRKLSVPGEERLIGHGISFCATCDGALYRGKRVAVIGGGNSAAEEALYLAGLGCEVLLIHRRDTLRAEQSVAALAMENAGITILWNCQVSSFEGDRRLSGVSLQHGRVEAVSAAFIAIGRIPDTELIRGQLDLDGNGFIVAGEDCYTNMPNVFAAGDARTKPLRQIATAVADGAVAASHV
ncbi:MAG: FAD-dependent oxidoreductase [Clostridia bacterium]|nr:FAD-dependent oxidoreductase [Clostridia bacterium]